MTLPRFVVLTTAYLLVCVGLLHGSAAATELAVTVRDVTGLAGSRPVTGGVPLAVGVAPKDSCFVLTDERGELVPCQTSVLARWKDESVRWVLLDFQAAPPPGGTARFTLGWSDRGPAPQLPVATVDSTKGVIQTGTMRLGPADDAVLSVGDRLDVQFTLIDDEGRRCQGVVESSDVEASGPVRGTLLLRGAFRGPDGSRVLGFRLRASVFAGLSRVFLEPHLLVDADTGVVHRIRGLSLDIVPRTPLKGVQLGGGSEVPSGASVRLLQIDDETCRFEGVEAAANKAPGWAELTDAAGTVAVAVRDFWQQWPKSIESDAARAEDWAVPHVFRGDVRSHGAVVQAPVPLRRRTATGSGWANRADGRSGWTCRATATRSSEVQTRRWCPRPIRRRPSPPESGGQSPRRAVRRWKPTIVGRRICSSTAT